MTDFLMYTVNRLTFGIIIACCIAIKAQAQVPPGRSVDPHSFDIAGVKLGMTADETIASLKAFNKKFVIIKNYWANDMQYPGQTGTPLATVGTFAAQQDADSPALMPEYSFLNDVVAEIAPPFCFDQLTNTGDPCVQFNEDHDEVNDIVHVWFSPIPGRERVIAIQRTQDFPNNPEDDPSFAGTLAAIYSKYTPTPSISEARDYQNLDWLFDESGNFISPDQIKALQSAGQATPTCLQGSLPESKAGAGIFLSFSLDSNGQTNTNVSKIISSLSDGNALYLSTSQAHETYEIQKEKMLAKKFLHGRGGTFYLGQGWGKPEDWGVWTTSSDAYLMIIPQNLEFSMPLRLTVTAIGFVSKTRPTQTVEVFADGRLIAQWVLQASSENYEALIPTKPDEQVITLHFHVDNPISPAELHLGQDTRRLGIALQILSIQS